MICTCQWEGHKTKTSTPEHIKCYLSEEKLLCSWAALQQAQQGPSYGNVHKPQAMSDEYLERVKKEALACFPECSLKPEERSLNLWKKVILLSLVC